MITTQNSVLSGAPTPQELELINSYTVKPLKAEEVYTFGIVLCDNEIDRDFERFDIPALEKLAELFVGKTGIFDHSMSCRDQTARIFSCRVETDENKVTSAGEKYTKLCARAYMPRSEKNAALIEEIDAGIKKETSVGCSVGRSVSSVCGKDGRTEPCAHIKGREYGGKLCRRILCDPADAYEWSIVAVPAPPANPGNALRMVVYTDEPGVQAYTGNFLDGTVTGKGGVTYPKRAAICLETQHYPDSPNKPNWPSVVLRPGETYTGHYAYKFTVVPEAAE